MYIYDSIIILIYNYFLVIIVKKMNINKLIRNLTIATGLVAIIGTGCAPVTCSPAPILENGNPAYTCQYIDETNQIAVANLEDVINQPELFEGETIQLSGYADYVGENTETLTYVLPYYNPATKTVQLNVSIAEKRVVRYRIWNEEFVDGFYLTAVAEKNSVPLFLPIAVSPRTYAPEADIYQTQLDITGNVVKNEEGDYLFEISQVQEAP
jgi:hypothetical protein